jgi:hypothetical protein
MLRKHVSSPSAIDQWPSGIELARRVVMEYSVLVERDAGITFFSDVREFHDFPGCTYVHNNKDEIAEPTYYC